MARVVGIGERATGEVKGLRKWLVKYVKGKWKGIKQWLREGKEGMCGMVV